ncbi:hypothetical protein MOMA_03235 [Moraxella macacae 0408225]|uniref:Lipoprotein n=1 Tax=Moraxella macacae 0408225 TaxID=1230338 RepID=L2FA86_9GAMM|nr:hypothetical protein [Moraxella macacae]ELA09383.1 hypothetical protein MOMA_03235 [Moraxella macacae 0408225]
MKFNTLTASLLATLSLSLTACSIDSAENGQKLIEQLQKSTTVKEILEDLKKIKLGDNPQIKQELIKFLTEHSAKTATREDDLAPLAFDRNNQVLFGGTASPLSYQDFLSTANNKKVYTANFAHCSSDCTKKDSSNIITTGEMKFSIQYDVEAQQWQAKDVTFSKLAKHTIKLSDDADGRDAITDQATQSTALATDNSVSATSAVLTRDSKKLDQRVFKLDLTGSKVQGLPEFHNIQLMFSKHGGYVTSLNKDFVLAGVRDDNLPKDNLPKPQSGTTNDKIITENNKSWSGYQLKIKNQQATKSETLTNLQFKDTTFNSQTNGKLKDFSVDINHNTQYVKKTGVKGGYLQFGKIPAYGYGYVKSNSRVDHNAGVIVLDPSAKFIVGTGNNRDINDNKNINGMFIAQRNK